LVKIIDSKESLSVQVHPNDENAAALGGEAKTEMWYVLGAKSGAKVFAGLKPHTNRPIFEKALHGLSLERMLVAIPAVADEAIFVPGGRAHSIGKGCLLLEVQQNSNTTYRVHDWGRVGKDGKPRELHVEQALRAIDWSDRGQARFTAGKAVQTGANSLRKVLECKYFQVERLDLGEVMQLENDGGSFHAFFTVSGSVTIEAGGIAVKAPAGVSSLLAASVRRYTLAPESGAARVLRISLA
jgi:mannose-6-phosphate isomerase